MVKNRVQLQIRRIEWDHIMGHGPSLHYKKNKWAGLETGKTIHQPVSFGHPQLSSNSSWFGCLLLLNIIHRLLTIICQLFTMSFAQCSPSFMHHQPFSTHGWSIISCDQHEKTHLAVFNHVLSITNYHPSCLLLVVLSHYRLRLTTFISIIKPNAGTIMSYFSTVQWCNHHIPSSIRHH